MIKIYFNFTKQFKHISSNTQTKLVNNTLIQKLGTQNEFKTFYKLNAENLNLVNRISFIRRFSERLIRDRDYQNQENMDFTDKIAHSIMQQIQTMEYKKYNDKIEDELRSFTMFLSCAQAIMTNFPQLTTKYTYYCQQIYQEISNNGYLSKVNLEEVQVILRCVTQLKDINVTLFEEKQMLDRVEQFMGQVEFKSATKLIQSLSLIQTIRPSLIRALFDKIEKGGSINMNVHDCCGVLMACKVFFQKLPQLNLEIKQIVQSITFAILEKRFNLNYKQLAIIFQCLSMINIDIQKPLLDYLELQVEKVDKLNIFFIAQIFHFYEEKGYYPNQSDQFTKRLYQFLEQDLKLNDSNVEIYCLFFKDFIPYANLTFFDISSNLLEDYDLNDFCLAKLIQGMNKCTFALDQVYDFVETLIKKLLSYKKPIDIHLLNAIIRCNLMFKKQYASKIQKAIDQQINQFSDQIIIGKFDYLSETNLESQLQAFLQVFLDFLKILQNNQEQLNPNLVKCIKYIQGKLSEERGQNKKLIIYHDSLKLYINE
ncbi:hypothetical protein pb186bvf_010360 [Paramecium bursaria]